MPALDAGTGPSETQSTETFVAGTGGGQPPFPGQSITVPESEEYFVVSQTRLQRLEETRIGWVLEIALLFGGAALGFLPNAVIALFDWPLDIPGFVNALFAVVGITGAGICGSQAFRRRNRSDTIFREIRRGDRFVRRSGQLVPAPPSAETSSESNTASDAQ